MAVARLAVANALWSPACFHAQQAAEKALKALFESVALPVPRTHDLVVLLDHLESARVLDPQPLREAALVLSAYAVDARYPGFEADPDEAREAVRLAAAVLERSRAQ